jgi:hypothetical protein
MVFGLRGQPHFQEHSCRRWTLEIFFDLEKNGHTYTGSVVAPIKTRTVIAGEHDGDAALAITPRLSDRPGTA